MQDKQQQQIQCIICHRDMHDSGGIKITCSKECKRIYKRDYARDIRSHIHTNLSGAVRRNNYLKYNREKIEDSRKYQKMFVTDSGEKNGDSA